MNDIDFLGLLREGSWPAVAGVFSVNFFRAFAKVYRDSLKGFIGNYLEIKLNIFRNRLDLQLSTALITGAYSKIENEIVAEVVRIYAINNRFSPERQKQIPTELRRAARRGISSVTPLLLKYSYAKTGESLAAPLNDFRNSEGQAEKFWAVIIAPIFNDASKQARYITISKVTEQVEAAREQALQLIRKK